MIAVPVRKYTIRDNVVGEGSKFIYADVNGRILCNRIQSMILPANGVDLELSTFEDKIIYKEYDSYGNPLEVEVGGVPIVYLWGYDGLYPIAEIKNATYTQVSEAVDTLRAILSNPNLQNSDLAPIQALSKEIFGASVSTYLYKPLVGVTNTTKETGESMDFEYDGAGRLSRTLRKGNLPLERYEYQY